MIQSILNIFELIKDIKNNELNEILYNDAFI